MQLYMIELQGQPLQKRSRGRGWCHVLPGQKAGRSDYARRNGAPETRAGGRGNGGVVKTRAEKRQENRFLSELGWSTHRRTCVFCRLGRVRLLKFDFKQGSKRRLDASV